MGLTSVEVMFTVCLNRLKEVMPMKQSQRNLCASLRAEGEAISKGFTEGKVLVRGTFRFTGNSRYQTKAKKVDF